MNRHSYRRLSVIPICFLLIIWLYSMPMTAQVFTTQFSPKLANWGGDGWGAPFFRTITFATVTSAISVTTAFFIAVLLRKSSYLISRLYPIFIIPAFLGNVGVGFIFKLLLLQHGAFAGLISSRAFFPTWAAMVGIQCWQYTPLFIYIFWLRLQLLPKNLQEFAVAANASALERTRDLYWPYCRNVASLLALLGIAEGLQETNKFQLILRASTGTNTELASQRISRYYDFYALVNPRFATDETLAYCAVFVLLSLFFVPIGIFFVIHTVRAFIATLNRLCISCRGKQVVRADALGVACLVAAILPSIALFPYLFHRDFVITEIFLRSCLFSLLALLAAMCVAILFSVTARLTWTKLLSGFTNRSLLFFIGLYLLELVPAIGLAFCGYTWLANIGLDIRSSFSATSLWLIGQVILVFPLLASFIVVSHFRVSSEEILFQGVCRANLVEIFQYSFMDRFRKDYVLVSLFAFSLIWNEDVLNSILSGFSQNIPSMALELAQRVDGLSSSYLEATNLILVSLIPVVVGLVLWDWLSSRITTDVKERRANGYNQND